MNQSASFLIHSLIHSSISPLPFPFSSGFLEEQPMEMNLIYIYIQKGLHLWSGQGGASKSGFAVDPGFLN